MLLKVVALPDNVSLVWAAGAAEAREKNAAATGRASILENIIVQEFGVRMKVCQWPMNRQLQFFEVLYPEQCKKETNVSRSLSRCKYQCMLFTVQSSAISEERLQDHHNVRTCREMVTECLLNFPNYWEHCLDDLST